MKKRKRFYKNVKRNQTWTEEIQGREIDFADKYASDGTYSDKFDYLRPKEKPKFKKKKLRKKIKRLLKRLAAIVVCLAVLGVGYTAMDVYMLRHRMPDINATENDTSQNTFSQISLNLKSEYIESVSLDGSVMLDAVISDAEAYGYNSVTFDIKRSEGSVGYKSALVNVDAYGAVAFPASNLKASTEKLTQNNILPVGIVYCYLDNLVPAADSSMAVLNSNGVLYRDSRDNTYLNPDSDDAYRYIKDIISEAYEMGITVFVLCGVDMPSDIRADYNDGFDTLSQRLYNDIGTDMKLVEAVGVSLGKDAAEKDSNEVSEKITNDLSSGQVYYITTSADKYMIKEKLEESGISSYILAD